MTTTVKVYQTRDSATAYLRKQGVKKDQYDHCIHKTAAGFECRLPEDAVPMRREAVVEPKAKAPAAAKPKAPVKAKPKKKPKARKPAAKKVAAVKRKVDQAKRNEATPGLIEKLKQEPKTLSDKIRQLVLKGKTNYEIVLALDLPAEHKHYPAWYRGELRRKGLLPAGLDKGN